MKYIKFIIFALFFLIDIKAQVSKTFYKCEYKYIDDFRNLTMRINQDGSIVFGNNSKDLSRTFRMAGSWNYLSKNKILLYIPPKDSALQRNKINPGARIPSPGSTIDWSSYYANRDISQIFPYLYGDTITFKKGQKFFYYKDFKFKRINKYLR